MGVEIIGILTEETEYQRKTLPPAVRRVAYRGLIYHACAIFVLGLNVSSNDPILKVMATQNYASPFALMVTRAGIAGLPDFIKAVTVVALLGVANMRLYVSVRNPVPCPLFSDLLYDVLDWLICRAGHYVPLQTRDRRSKYLQRHQGHGMSRYMLLHSLLSPRSSHLRQSKRQRIWYSLPSVGCSQLTRDVRYHPRNVGTRSSLFVGRHLRNLPPFPPLHETSTSRSRNPR